MWKRCEQYVKNHGIWWSPVSEPPKKRMRCEFLYDISIFSDCYAMSYKFLYFI